MFEQSEGREASAEHVAGATADVLMERLETTVAAILDRHPDGLDETALRAELAAVERVKRQLHARSCTLTATLTARHERRVREAHPNEPRRAERAARELQTELANELKWTPSQAKDHRAVGEQLRRSPGTADAMRAGELTAAHARHLERTLRSLWGDQRRDAEARLLQAARSQDPVTFGRTCQRLLAEYDHAAADRAEERRHARRRANVTRTPDHMLAVYGQWSGMDAEFVGTAVDAYRRPDRPDEHRTPEQRTADAVVDLCRAALRAGEAPTSHRVRPHVLVTIDAADLRDRQSTATAHLGSGTDLPLSAVRQYLDDAGWSWMVVDNGLPMAAGPETSHVPIGLWRALVLRDGGCIADGCDANPDWCDVMHLAEPRAAGGSISVKKAALGCRPHHRKFDNHGWTITWHNGRPILHHPDRPPRTGPDPGG